MLWVQYYLSYITMSILMGHHYNNLIITDRTSVRFSNTSMFTYYIYRNTIEL